MGVLGLILTLLWSRLYFAAAKDRKLQPAEFEYIRELLADCWTDRAPATAVFNASTLNILVPATKG
jgi:hypothetical protein